MTDIIKYNNMGNRTNCFCNTTHLPQEEEPTIQYDGQRFKITNLMMNQAKLIAKVQTTAKQFCFKNKISQFYIPLLTRVIAYRQQQTFQQIWIRLSEQKRKEFLQSMNNVQHDLMDSFYFHFVKNSKRQSQITRKLHNISAPTFQKITSIEETQVKRYRMIAQRYIKQNRVAVIFMCAGYSSRFQTQDKFLKPFKLYQNFTIFDFLFKRLKRNLNNHKQIPIVLCCNETNIKKIIQYLRSKKYYGLNQKNFRFTTSTSMVTIDSNGKYCINQNSQLIKQSIGTAQTAELILSENIQTFLKSKGVTYASFHGCENVFENPCDLDMLGMMIAQSKKVSAKCCHPKYYSQSQPRYYNHRASQRLKLLSCEELFYVSSEMLQELPVAMNSMIFQVKELKRIVEDFNNNLYLAENYHVIKRQQNTYNFINNRYQKIICYNFERDLRNYLTLVDHPLLLHVPRKQYYLPVITSKDEFSFSQIQKYLDELLSTEDPLVEYIFL